MIRLATVFSGIGAIEHALQRMEIETEIVFACDNGDVELDTKKVDCDIDLMSTEIKKLKNQVQQMKVLNKESSEYMSQLDGMLDAVEKEYNKLIESLSSKYKEKDKNEVTVIDKAVLDAKIIVKDNLKVCTASKKKKYKEVLERLNCNRDFQDGKLLAVLQTILILNEDEIDFKSSDMTKINEIYHKDIKKIVKKAKDISERLCMLHDKLYYLDVTNTLNAMDSYEEKKKYVDKLYAGKEKQNKVKQSYMANYNVSEKDFHWNVAFLDGKQYEGKVDLFVGGSPCQSFSLVGKQRGLEDTRGTLFYEYARLVSEIRPKVFIYENVKALLSNDEGNTWKKIQEVFTSLDYVWFQSVLNAKDYGIPQNRERVFVIGFRKDLVLSKDFVFPEKMKLEKFMPAFLMDNVSGRYYLNKKGVEFVTNEKNLTKRFTQIDGEIQLCQKKNQQFNWHGDFVFVEENKDMEKTMVDLEKYFLSEKVKKYVLSTGTKGFYSKPEINLQIARPLLTTMHKMHRAGVDNYVETEGRLRKLTPRECLRLMGFCDSFKIVVSDTAAYQQAGNSIVVDVLINIMKSILSTYPELTM